MESLAHSPASARSPRGRALRVLGPPRPFALIALGAVLFLLGCGAGGERRDPALRTLVAGKRAAPIPPAQLARAARVARLFAASYARSIYARQPPPMPGATLAVDRELTAAASRVPLARRGRRPHLVGFHLKLVGAERLDASIAIEDGRSPRFSVGIAVSRHGGRWWVTAISAPE